MTSPWALQTTYVDSTTLTAVLPADKLRTAKTATIYVSDNTYNTISLRLPFAIGTMAPLLSGSEPQVVYAGNPGFNLTVYGSYLRPGMVVRWNGMPLSMVSTGPVWMAWVPASLIASPGSANITLVNSDGLVSNSRVLPVNPANTPPGYSPVITSINPTKLRAGGEGATLTISGSGFFTGSTVYWNNTPLSTTVSSPLQLFALVPASLMASPATVSITVVRANGIASLPRSLTIESVIPISSSVTPGGFIAGGDLSPITINGSRFLAGDRVFWNSVPLVVTSSTPTQLMATVPAQLISSPGTAVIKVVSGSLTSNPYPVVVYASVPIPTLAAVSPAYVNAGAAGFTVNVTGSDFLPGATIYWAGTPLATTFVSASEMNAAVPAGLVTESGQFDITMANAGGASSIPFTQMLVRPVLSTLTPSSIVAGSANVTLSVTGIGFRPTASCRIRSSDGDWVLRATYLSSTALSLQVPPEAIMNPGTITVSIGDTTNAAASRLVTVIVEPGKPTISTVLPGSATAAGPEFQLTVNGAHFYIGARVRWNTTDLSTRSHAVDGVGTIQSNRIARHCQPWRGKRVRGQVPHDGVPDPAGEPAHLEPESGFGRSRRAGVCPGGPWRQLFRRRSDELG
ncbi:IPT/TIG domain-containing protein [uncultured Paludibaculum sp.]|uniref:IPT/TIG domain-containing protein n=1 Tax=uncultured Paludibaculum sp. TaxID=1765020 RepID=UPI002AAB0337|nr:IPT/TIG domain-containing protein [uncultured Paludibaculum sp.]